MDCWHGCSCVWAVNGHVICLSQRLYVAGIVWDSITHLVLLLWSIRAAVKLVKFGDMVTKGLAWRYDSNTMQVFYMTYLLGLLCTSQCVCELPFFFCR